MKIERTLFVQAVHMADIWIKIDKPTFYKKYFSQSVKAQALQILDKAVEDVVKASQKANYPYSVSFTDRVDVFNTSTSKHKQITVIARGTLGDAMCNALNTELKRKHFIVKASVYKIEDELQKS